MFKVREDEDPEISCKYIHVKCMYSHVYDEIGRSGRAGSCRKIDVCMHFDCDCNKPIGLFWIVHVLADNYGTCLMVPTYLS